MIESLREHEDGALLEADLCIVGAGAAGITIARELRGSPLRVILVESGGFSAELETQALYEAEVGGPLDYQPAATRMRFFGGSTNCWTGFCAPLDAPDFEERDWIPHSGWPIGRADLDPFYVRAQRPLELGPFFYDAAALTGEAGGLMAFAPERLRNALWQHSPPSRFGTLYRAELEQADRIRVLLHANVMRLETDEARRQVRELSVRSLEGRRARVRARAFVLAAGGIENPRLLLLSDGLGNGHDLVGRFFMEHVVSPAAWIVPRPSPAWMDPYASIELPGGAAGSAGVGASLVAQREQRILNAVATFVPGRTDLTAGYLTLARLRRSIERGELPDDFAREVCRVLVDIDDVAEGLRARMRDEPYTAFRPDPTTRVLNVHLEQAPDPDSRVRLGEALDALGQRRARIDWRLGESERRTIRVTNRLIGEELGRLDLGRLREDDWLTEEGERWHIVAVKCHHMGTTRMAVDPRRGVVDADCRVHGTANLYVAGSSVFPTSGFANPTLTLVALALRLADHLREALA